MTLRSLLCLPATRQLEEAVPGRIEHTLDQEGSDHGRTGIGISCAESAVVVRRRQDTSTRQRVHRIRILSSHLEDSKDHSGNSIDLLLESKSDFAWANERQLLKHMIEIGIAHKILRWIDSFLSDRSAMVLIDGRTGNTHDIQAGMPQGSSALPVLFILSMSAMFPYLSEKYPDMKSGALANGMSFVSRMSHRVKYRIGKQGRPV